VEKVFAIYASDNLYTTRFMEYFKTKKDIGFEISAFTRKENLEAFLSVHKIEILLLGEHISHEEVPIENINYVYQLTENKENNNKMDQHLIYKYQPVQMVMSEILRNYAIKTSNTQEALYPKSKKLISIFSLRPSAEIISYAWSISIQLSELQKVLFVPLELLSLPLLSFADSKDLSLSEFIYYLKENPNQIIKMKTLLGHSGYLSYLTGIMHGADLLSLTQEDILRWVEALNMQTDFSSIIFYLGFYSDAAIELMKISDTVLIPTTGLPYEKAMLREWERQMEHSGINTSSEKFQRILLPAEASWNGRPMSLQELANTEVWVTATNYITD